MPKIIIDNISGGYNFNSAAHLIQDSQARLLKNVSWRNGRWEKREGYTQPIAASADLKPFTEIVDFIKNDGTTFLIGATTDHIYRESANSWIQEHTQGTPLAITEKWFFTEIFDKLYAANGQDAVIFVDDPTTAGDSFVSLTTTGKSITRANIVLAFHSRLLFFNTTDALDGLQPTRVQWSDVADPTTVGTTSFVDLDQSNAPIISAAVFRSNAIVAYKTDSVWLIQDVGDPFFFTPRFGKEIGILAPKARTTVPNGDFFVSNMGFHIFVGNGIIDIGLEEEAYNFFRAQLNDAKKDNVYCWTDMRNQEVHIMYPTGTADEPNEEIIWNWRRNNFVVHNIGGYCGFYQFRTITTPVVYHGSSSGLVKKRTGTTGAGETDNGAVITTTYQSKAFRNPSVDSENRELDDYAQISVVYPSTSPTGINGTEVRIGEADTGDETPTWSTAVTLVDTDGRAPAAYPKLQESVGKYLTVEVSKFDFLSAYDLSWEGAGQE